ncbi:MAG: hypothetical protein A2X48_00925 [Lentisphaerae bacterium GWF2_49_21]|nr:MAG: hypothetical protein A2X48_00925 [Lentisphaerae bacterium GWF2_49_21]
MQENKVHFNPKIMAVGLNPAWQKTLLFPEFIPGEVNRAAKISLFPAGKGINFARAAGIWGAEVLVCQFLGGQTGKNIKDGLAKERLRHLTVNASSQTRTCTTCLCGKSGQMTELIEPSAEIPSHLVKTLKNKILDRLTSHSGIALCGTYPAGVGADFYADIAATARKSGKPVMLDGVTGVGKTLDAGIHVLKVNKSEFSILSGKKNIFQGAKSFFRRYNVEIAAVTAGPSNAFLFDENGLYEYKLPDCGRILNPIGAGDTVSAVLFSELLRGRMPAEAFRLALGAGTASCFRLKSADFSPKQARNIAGEIRIKKRK